jgi:hypothetical protein
MMELKPIVKGLATFIPGAYRLFGKHRTGGTDSAAYCYEVWLKHLTFLWANGMRSMPQTLAELGPGDSLGVGLAALLSGVSNYYALDIVHFSDPERNLKVFEELVGLFKARAARPTKGWPDYDAFLDVGLFPHCILSDEILERSLREERLHSIRAALVDLASDCEEVSIKYMVPWLDEGVIEKESVDVILSHSVLEHIVDLENSYQALYSWLRPGGMMSHQIDFGAHGVTSTSNGYWSFSPALWKIIVGRRPFLINREPCSVHAQLMKREGFQIICHLKNHRSDGIARTKLSSVWRDLSDDDLTCAETFIQARKPL